MTNPHELKSTLATIAAELGFDAFGVAAADSENSDRDHLTEWLKRGYHASMEWMARDPEKRSDVRVALPSARSVISLAVNYHTPVTAGEDCGSLKVSRYAWGEDYHEVVGRKLKALQERLHELVPNAESITGLDTSPIMEKSWAERAGLGWIGRNGNLITRNLGSWVFLAEIITDIELPPDEPHTQFCGSCNRCMEACPTEAIIDFGVVDSRKCISYWTIEHRGDLPEELAQNFDGWIFGCDICQDVCPWNRFSQATQEPAFEPRCDCTCPPGERWENLSETEFKQQFGDSAIRRAKSTGLARNIRSQSHNPLREALRSVAWEPLDGLDDINIDGLKISQSPDSSKTS
jgi:epoxyqueuosine reductase